MTTSPTINSVHGRIRSITGTDPAANTEISEIVPARRRWRLLAVRFALLTDANAADRFIALKVTNGTNTLFSKAHATPQTASKTQYYHFAACGDSLAVVANSYSIAFPSLMLNAGFKIETSSLGLQTTDNFSAPTLLVEEWIDP